MRLQRTAMQPIQHLALIQILKGAKGVILVTTKRGQEGKAKIEVGFNATLKAPSKLPNKYDSYDALKMCIRDRACGVWLVSSFIRRCRCTRLSPDVYKRQPR